MLVVHRGAKPVIHKTATICPGTIISGDVNIGSYTTILPGATVTSEGAPVRIKNNCIVMECAVIRGAGVHPCTIGDHVLIGPHSYVSGATIERDCFIAMGASIFNGSFLGEGTVVAVHAVVHISSCCLPLSFIPIGHIAIGNPLRIYPPDKAKEAHRKISSVGFTKTIFGFDSESMSNAEANRELCSRYSRSLSRHKDDKIFE